MDSDGKPSCAFDDCDLSETARYKLIYISHFYLYFAFILFRYIEDFADSNAYFVEEFGKVYSKVLSKGYENLENLS